MTATESVPNEVDYAAGFRNDLETGWLPEMILGHVRTHLGRLQSLAQTIPDRDKAISDIEKFIAELEASHP